MNTMAAIRAPWTTGWRFALLAGVFLFATAPCVPAAEQHRDVTGTTVILHGLQLSATVPDWTFYMAEAIRLRAGGGRIFEYDAATGGLVDCGHPACGPQGSAGETVIVFDWAADSAESGTGFSEAAAEALVGGLVRWSRGEPPQASLDALHLIGHSRGAVVASETAERLIAAGLPAPEHITTLDPHDAGAFGLTDEQSEPEGLWIDDSQPIAGSSRSDRGTILSQGFYPRSGRSLETHTPPGQRIPHSPSGGPRISV